MRFLPYYYFIIFMFLYLYIYMYNCMFVSALPDLTCNSEKSANGGNKQILLLLLLLLLYLEGLPHGGTYFRNFTVCWSDKSCIIKFGGPKSLKVSKKGLFWEGFYLESNPAISNSVNSKFPLFRRKIEFPWIYPYVFSHLLSAITNSVISNYPLFRTHRSFPTP